MCNLKYEYDSGRLSALKTFANVIDAWPAEALNEQVSAGHTECCRSRWWFLGLWNNPTGSTCWCCSFCNWGSSCTNAGLDDFEGRSLQEQCCGYLCCVVDTTNTARTHCFSMFFAVSLPVPDVLSALHAAHRQRTEPGENDIPQFLRDGAPI